MSPFREEVHAAILRMTDAGLRYGADSPEYAQALRDYKQALMQGPLVFAREGPGVPPNGRRARIKRLLAKLKLLK